MECAQKCLFLVASLGPRLLWDAAWSYLPEYRVLRMQGVQRSSAATFSLADENPEAPNAHSGWVEWVQSRSPGFPPAPPSHLPTVGPQAMIQLSH